MAKKIIIDGIIGFDIQAYKIRELIQDEKDELEIDIASPGGFVFDGLEIFNLIRDYSRNKNKVTTKLVGLAASMASYIALAGDRIIAEDNAIFMIHNVWTIAGGDYREMQKEANNLEGLTNLLAKTYSKKAKKSIKEIREIMDDETFYFGDEMVKAGFVDEIIKTEKNKEKDELLMLAKGQIKKCFDVMEKTERAKKDMQKAAALIMDFNQKEIKPENKTEVKNNMDEKQLEILTTENKELKNKLENIKAHLQFADVAPKEVLENIKNEKPYNIECSAAYAKVQFQAELLKKREQDNPENLNPVNPENGETEAETNAYIAKLKSKRGIK